MVQTPRYEGPCHHGTVRLRIADGGDDLQTWTATANIILNQ
jgi:hypothetical protein